jgi:hypothetical protein
MVEKGDCGLLGGHKALKFTTLIPTRRNDGTEVRPAALQRIIEALWRPFQGMTEEGLVTGYWIDDDSREFRDLCLKVSIECGRERLAEAIRAVKRIGRQLGQRAMYFEVSGYDGVQILRTD